MATQAKKTQAPKITLADLESIEATSVADLPKVEKTKGDLNKEQIAAQDRALKAAILLTRENLVAAAKLTARTIARAEDSIAKAGLALMWRFRDEGESFKATPCDYDRDIAPLTTMAIAEAYSASTDASKKTWRAFAKIFFLAGVHSIDTDETTISKIVDSFRDQLKAANIIAEHGNDKAKRAPRPASVKDVRPTTATPSTGAATTESSTSTDTSSADTSSADISSAAPVAPKYSPKKVYTVEDRRNAAMILCGTPSATADIVAAFEQHREQVLKFIRQLVESAKA